MHITGFLITGIIFIGVLCLFSVYERTNIFKYSKRKYDLLNTEESQSIWIRTVYLLMFAGLVSCAMSTMKSYIYPEDKNVFSNVDYHVLSHKGYRVGPYFYLSNGFTSESDGDPAKALWDNRNGILALDRKNKAFLVKEFCDPIYIRKDKDAYHLVNQSVTADVSKGFTLTRGRDTLYVMSIGKDDKDRPLYISKLYSKGKLCVTDTSTFTRHISQGYPLLDIIAASPQITISEDLEAWFGDAYLVRTEIPMKGHVPVFDSDEASPLCLMPGISFYSDENLAINGKSYMLNDTTILFRDYENEGKVTFFCGLGKKKTEEFRLSYLPNDSMRLEFLKPDMRQIKDTLERVFINSSINDIAKESLVGGYMYNKFEDENNHNHINAHFQYAPADSKKELSIDIEDLNSLQNDSSCQYKCGKEFYLYTKDQSAAWIFEVKDMRGTNNLKDSSILLFSLVMLLAVTLRVLLDSWLKHHSLSLTELATYVVLFCLCIVRLILGWRMSTFIPVEDISLPMYEKMRASILNIWLWLVAILPLFVTFVELIKSRRKVRLTLQGDVASPPTRTMQYWGGWSMDMMIKFARCIHWGWMAKFLEQQKNQGSKPLMALVLFIIAIVCCYTFRNFQMLNRVFNIPVPIISFLMFELVICKLEEEKNLKLLWYRTAALSALCLYLFLADAGFMVVLLAYMLIYHLMLGVVYKKCKGKRRYLRYRHILCILSAVVLFLILKFEGKIMISFLRYASSLVVVSVVAGLLLLIYAVIRRVINSKTRLNKSIGILFVVVIIAGGAYVGFYGMLNLNAAISEKIESKAHMRYRAEIQRLKGEQKIDDLIKNCEFDSDDIIFIMRSAHNQWFINQYIRAGQKLQEDGKYFHIQPHSNQGATYTTQTTDLVVTRYLLAEHGEDAVMCILWLWLILILLNVLEFNMTDKKNRLFLSGLILVYVLALMVYLSATNRIVFVGQDFPLVSLQSNVAVIFPILLILLLVFRCIDNRKQEKISDPPLRNNVVNGLAFVLMLPLLTVSCIWFIEQKGKDQEETQFNVSRLISQLSLNVDDINDRFSVFQVGNSRSLKGKSVTEVWDMFVEQDTITGGGALERYRNPDSPDFFSSLLSYFETKQASKTDINQFLHLRRRGDRCYLALNKQHYFIPAIMNEETQWTGDIYAAKKEPEWSLFEHNKEVVDMDNRLDIEYNILKPEIKSLSNNMSLMRFGEEWTYNAKALFLISARQELLNSTYFNITSNERDFKGDGKTNQLVTAVRPGDLLSLYRKKYGKTTQVLMNAQVVDNGTPYIVRNMWLNGHKRLFFPMGRVSMWPYHLGNLVSDVFRKNAEYRDSTLFLSLDFDLCKSLYSTVIGQIGNTMKTSRKLQDCLDAFAGKKENAQCDKRNSLYFDKQKRQMCTNKKASAIEREAQRRINRVLEKTKNNENPLSKALDLVRRMPYDFTAVAIDGDGHIRALFDYSRNRHVDPNNLTHLNRVICELYQDGSSGDERDIFGSKALQYIPMGPGSSFKPIAYSAVASQKHLNWQSIQVMDIGRNKDKKHKGKDGFYGYYGGVKLQNEDIFKIDGGVVDGAEYLTQSNNLHHSVIIMLGMQESKNVENVMRTYTKSIKSEEAFPVFRYGGRPYCFNPEVWNKPNKRFEKTEMLTNGLFTNYKIMEDAPRTSTAYNHLFGDDDIVKALYNGANSSRGWVFPERASINNPDRTLSPLRHGFNQILLGAAPLQQTPLQMAVNASRLASLNSADNMVTILDGDRKKDYNFFKLDGSWTQSDYLIFMKQGVWAQLAQVPIRGTAKQLALLAKRMRDGVYGKSYYLYCKTGTLNMEGNEYSESDRMKHLLVIISDTPLENVKDVNALKKVRYYTLYLSFMGVNKNEFNNGRFEPYIINVLRSQTFKDYMNKKK